MTRKTNSYINLRDREYKLNTSNRVVESVVRSIICEKSSNFSETYSIHSKQTIFYENGLIYEANYRKCSHVCGRKDARYQAYQLPRCTSAAKISDCLTCVFPSENVSQAYRGYKSCTLTLSEDGYLRRYDLYTGELLQELFISSRLKFRNLSWNDFGESITVKVLNKKASVPTDAEPVEHNGDWVATLAVFSTHPLQFIAMFQVTKDVFGSNVTNAMIAQSLLLVMHADNTIKIYSLERILRKYKCHDEPIHNGHDVEERVLGLNVHITARPPLLLEVKCQDHDLQLGGFPWHSITIPHRSSRKFHIKSLRDKEISGVLELTSPTVETEKCVFHPDESGRILFTGESELSVLKLEETPTGYELKTQYRLDFNQQELANTVVYTASGREVKQRISQQQQQKYKHVIKSVEYDEDLDILVVAVYNTSDMVCTNCSGKIYLYDNQSGKLLKTVIPTHSLDEDGDVTVTIDKDLIIHISTDYRRHHKLHVYKLNRQLPHDPSDDDTRSIHNKRRPRPDDKSDNKKTRQRARSRDQTNNGASTNQNTAAGDTSPTGATVRRGRSGGRHKAQEHIGGKLVSSTTVTTNRGDIDGDVDDDDVIVQSKSNIALNCIKNVPQSCLCCEQQSCLESTLLITV